MRRLLLSIVDRTIRGIIGCALGAIFGATVQGPYLGINDIEGTHNLSWIGPVVGSLVGMLLCATIGHWEFNGRAKRVTIGIFAGFIIGIFVGVVIGGKAPAVDWQDQDWNVDHAVRLGAIFGPLIGGFIGAGWKSRRDSPLHK